MDLEVAKKRLIDEIDNRAQMLVQASHQIHAHPELGFEEVFAHDLLTGMLSGEGIEVERGAYGLGTAFSAHAGSSGPMVALCCEYDALPGIGHACGHNIIAAAGIGAGIAAAVLAEELGGRVLILGTPAEEGGGGKAIMIDRGALAGVDAALMVHPAGEDLASMNAIAVQQIWCEYVGLASHAAAAPHKGRNALDAAVLGYSNIAALRQHIRGDERIHGIITDGGEKPNIVPARAASQWYVRARDVDRLEQLKPRVFACLRAGADAAGCEMNFEWREPIYADMRDNSTLIEFYSRNVAVLGRPLVDPATTSGVVGSTDMGNVSQVVPSIHPMIAVSPAHVSIHTPEFAKYAAGPEGDAAVLDGAKALAMTVADIWLRPSALFELRAAFDASAAAGVLVAE